MRPLVADDVLQPMVFAEVRDTMKPQGYRGEFTLKGDVVYYTDGTKYGSVLIGPVENVFSRAREITDELKKQLSNGD